MALARLPLLSFDIETAGEIAGIVQISAENVRFKINSAKKKVGSDHAGDILREEDTFNRYINPEVRPEYWDQHSISVHGILPDDERIINIRSSIMSHITFKMCQFVLQIYI
jgi:hypothetical protein